MVVAQSLMADGNGILFSSPFVAKAPDDETLSNQKRLYQLHH
jgi:hypothetical protein